MDLKRLRHEHYDQLMHLVFRFWSYKVLTLLYDSKAEFHSVFCNKGSGGDLPQFEVSITFGANDELDSTPTMEEHHLSFEKVFEDMEEAVFKNQFLLFFMHDLNDLFFYGPNIYTRNIFKNMKIIMDRNQKYKYHSDRIFERLDGDIEDTNRFIDKYKKYEEIIKECNEWTSGAKNKGVEMNIYQSTYKKMEEYKKTIANIPSQAQRMGTILIETNSLKKSLAAMPAKVLDGIQQNMQDTMMQETKTLKEDLTKITEILSPLPTSLNTYVE